MSYIAKKINFKEVGKNYEIDGKTYHINEDLDPEYLKNEVLDISYWTLLDDNNEIADYVLAYNKIPDVDTDYINEWSDEWDLNNPQVIKFI